MIQQPDNWPEPIVMGVVDGFVRRAEPGRHGGPGVTLERDEALRVRTRDGQPLLEIILDDSGPVVRLLQDDISLDIPGGLRVSARSIELAAREGGVNVTASDDVVMKGETVRLN